MKKILVSSFVFLTLLGSISIPAFAANSNTTKGNQETTTSISENNCRKQKRDLTPEEKAEMKAKYEAAQKKWASLTDEQKNEIYKLMDNKIDIKIQMIDKYLEYGIIDKDTANNMKSKLNNYKTQMRESGKMPMLRMCCR